MISLFLASALPLSMTGYVGDDMSIAVVDGVFENGSCYATWTDTLEVNGKTNYNVVGRNGETKRKMMYCAGYLEGRMAQKRIYQAYINNIVASFNETNETVYPQYISEYFAKNYKYMKQMVEENKDDVYWQNIDAFLQISDGMYNGYLSVAPENEFIDDANFRVHNSMPDTFDLMTANGKLDPTSNLRAKCTAGIRLLPDFSDIYIFHNAWTDYRNAFGHTVDYYFPIEGFAAKRVSLTTLVGMISSLDDWYIADSGIIAFETTIMSQNVTMLREFIKPESLLCGYRTLMAMFTTNNGHDWVKTFLKHNSGTYNNDYFVINMNLFNRNEKPTKDLVWLVEQLPTDKEYIYDVTSNLTNDGFISSFNVPFTEEVYYICQYDKVENTSQFYHKYKEHPRYQISSRELRKVMDFEQMKKVARYNDYKNDPLSRGKPYYAIASREDLLGETPAGAMNQKVVSGSKGFTTMEYVFCGGTPNDAQPTFVWSTSPFANLSHIGLPDQMNFSWITMNETKFDKCLPLSKKQCIDTSFCGYCGKSKKCMPGNEEGPFNGKCYDKWETKFTSYTTYIIVLCVIIGVVVVLGVALSVYIYKRSRATHLENKPLLD